MLGTGVEKGWLVNLVVTQGLELKFIYLSEKVPEGVSMGTDLKMKHRARAVSGILMCSEYPEQSKASEAGEGKREQTTKISDHLSPKCRLPLLLEVLEKTVPRGEFWTPHPLGVPLSHHTV